MKTEEMVIDLCSALVGSDKRFKNKDTDGEYRPYKTYRDLYPRWIITNDQSIEASLYWKWLLAHYSKEIVKEFSMKDTEIPDEWKEISWEDARQNLIEMYHVRRK